MPAPKSKPKVDPAPDLPDLERHDEVYFRHPKGAGVGKVLARGVDGFWVEADGKRHQIPWPDLLGHKTRVRPDMKVVDQGEDGVLLEAPDGGRRFLSDPMGADDAPLAKAEPGPIVFLMGRADELNKAIANQPGLSLKPVTDKAGHQTKRWTRNSPDQPKPRDPAQARTESATAGHPGQGEKVSFTAGEFHGEGEVVGDPGRDGSYVRDGSGRLHQVRWDEMKGAGAPAEDAGATTEKKAPRAESKPSAKPEEKREKPFYDDKATKKLPGAAAQPHKTWEDMSAAAPKALGEFKDALHAVSSELGLRTDLEKPAHMTPKDQAGPDGFAFIGSLKDEKRAKEKVEGDYDGDYSKLRDMVRGTIAVSTIDQVHKAVAAVEAAGLKLLQKPKDRFANPTEEGYRDLMAVVRLPGGMLAELQFHMKSMVAAKAKGHADYARARSLQGKYGEAEPTDQWHPDDHAAFYDARKRQRRLYDSAWQKGGGAS